MFAILLADLRVKRGFSQSRLGREAGFDHSYICRLELGLRQPSREAVELIAGALQLDSDTLDRLLLSAGFRPNDNINLFADEPSVVSVVRLLRDPNTPERVRGNIREALELLCKQWKAISDQWATAD